MSGDKSAENIFWNSKCATKEAELCNRIKPRRIKYNTFTFLKMMLEDDKLLTNKYKMARTFYWRACEQNVNYAPQE